MSRSILLQMNDGTQVIVEDVPDTAKITFGPLIPGSKDFRQNSGSATALRIYTGTNNQLAVFTNVSTFRDLSLRIKTRSLISKHGEPSVWSYINDADEIETKVQDPVHVEVPRLR